MNGIFLILIGCNQTNPLPSFKLVNLSYFYCFLSKAKEINFASRASRLIEVSYFSITF